MKTCAKSNEQVVRVIQLALLDEIEFDDAVLEVLDNEIYLRELHDLILLFSLDADTIQSEGFHELVLAIEERTGETLTSMLFGKNKSISAKVVGKLVDNLVANDHATIMADMARDLAEQKLISPRDLHRLFKVIDLPTRKRIAEHPNTSIETLWQFIADKSIEVRRLVAGAPNADNRQLLYLIRSSDETAITKICRRPDITDFICKELLVSTNQMPYKKRLKVFVADNPEWLNLSVLSSMSGLKPKSLRVPQVSCAEIIANHLREADKILLDVRHLITTDHRLCEDQLQDLIEQYKRDENRWEALAKHPLCPMEILQKIFIAGHDACVNPMVQARLCKDFSYLRCLIPNAKKTKMKLAKSSQHLGVLSAIIHKELESTKPDQSLLQQICQNSSLDNDLLELIYEGFKLKEVMSHPNCSRELRSLALKGADLKTRPFD